MANQALVLVLAGVWVALLLPTALRNRRGDARRVVGSRNGRVADRRGTPDVGEPAIYRFNEAAAVAVELQPATVEDAVVEGVLMPQMAPLTSDERVERVAPRPPDTPVEAIRVDGERRAERRSAAQRRATFFGLLGALLVAAALAVVVGGLFVPIAGISLAAVVADVAWLRRRVVRLRQAAEVVADLEDAAAQRRADEGTDDASEPIVVPPAAETAIEGSFDDLRRAVGQS